MHHIKQNPCHKPNKLRNQLIKLKFYCLLNDLESCKTGKCKEFRQSGRHRVGFTRFL